MNTNPESSITLRPLHAWEEYLAAEELQRAVWQMPDWRDAVPANLLITVQKNGGLALGAFDGAHLVGLAFSFIGYDHHFDPPLLKQCSHMLAVLPAYQSRKLGVMLKLKQRELTMDQGIALMTWTYDPLLALNANLNFVRLGAIARRYVENAYGAMTDGLNAGLASDRFEVEWWLDTPRVRERVARAGAHPDWDKLVRNGARVVLETEWDDQARPRIRHEQSLEGDTLLVEIPTDLAAIKSSSPELAREWRTRTREAFTRAFADGYAATDFVFASREGTSRAAYVLTRDVGL
jgi:predicted GNAT superfamily acetyltransferase